jgi:hypothetical protein
MHEYTLGERSPVPTCFHPQLLVLNVLWFCAVDLPKGYD